MTAVHRVLVLVHPGSACGSANFNIGKFEARAARDALCSELDNWRGDVLVIDGELSDELEFYPSFDLAIRDCLQRNPLVASSAAGSWETTPTRYCAFASTPRALEKDLTQPSG